ncbi:hypothetical protein CLOP_g20517 [Closterium sp. NIES-67]|nr:hypothetical protein CLOP_g20517 [Closterium sp. NIES-67]
MSPSQAPLSRRHSGRLGLPELEVQSLEGQLQPPVVGGLQLQSAGGLQTVGGLQTLEGKLQLLEIQRQLSAVRCQAFVEALDSAIVDAEENGGDAYADAASSDASCSNAGPSSAVPSHAAAAPAAPAARAAAEKVYVPEKGVSRPLARGASLDASYWRKGVGMGMGEGGGMGMGMGMSVPRDDSVKSSDIEWPSKSASRGDVLLTRDAILAEVAESSEAFASAGQDVVSAGTDGRRRGGRAGGGAGGEGGIGGAGIPTSSSSSTFMTSPPSLSSSSAASAAAESSATSATLDAASAGVGSSRGKHIRRLRVRKASLDFRRDWCGGTMGGGEAPLLSAALLTPPLSSVPLLSAPVLNIPQGGTVLGAGAVPAENVPSGVGSTGGFKGDKVKESCELEGQQEPGLLVRGKSEGRGSSQSDASRASEREGSTEGGLSAGLVRDRVAPSYQQPTYPQPLHQRSPRQQSSHQHSPRQQSPYQRQSSQEEESSSLSGSGLSGSGLSGSECEGCEERLEQVERLRHMLIALGVGRRDGGAGNPLQVHSQVQAQVHSLQGKGQQQEKGQAKGWGEGQGVRQVQERGYGYSRSEFPENSFKQARGDDKGSHAARAAAAAAASAVGGVGTAAAAAVSGGGGDGAAASRGVPSFAQKQKQQFFESPPSSDYESSSSDASLFLHARSQARSLACSQARASAATGSHARSSGPQHPTGSGIGGGGDGGGGGAAAAAAAATGASDCDTSSSDASLFLQARSLGRSQARAPATTGTHARSGGLPYPAGSGSNSAGNGGGGGGGGGAAAAAGAAAAVAAASGAATSRTVTSTAATTAVLQPARLASSSRQLSLDLGKSKKWGEAGWKSMAETSAGVGVERGSQDLGRRTKEWGEEAREGMSEEGAGEKGGGEGEEREKAERSNLDISSSSSVPAAASNTAAKAAASAPAVPAAAAAAAASAASPQNGDAYFESPPSSDYESSSSDASLFLRPRSHTRSLTRAQAQSAATRLPPLQAPATAIDQSPDQSGSAGTRLSPPAQARATARDQLLAQSQSIASYAPQTQSPGCPSATAIDHHHPPSQVGSTATRLSPLSPAPSTVANQPLAQARATVIDHHPSCQPSCQTSSQPSSQPTSQPSSQPSSQAGVRRPVGQRRHARSLSGTVAYSPCSITGQPRPLGCFPSTSGFPSKPPISPSASRSGLGFAAFPSTRGFPSKPRVSPRALGSGPGGGSPWGGARAEPAGEAAVRAGAAAAASARGKGTGAGTESGAGYRGDRGEGGGGGGGGNEGVRSVVNGGGKASGTGRKPGRLMAARRLSLDLKNEGVFGRIGWEEWTGNYDVAKPGEGGGRDVTQVRVGEGGKSPHGGQRLLFGLPVTNGAGAGVTEGADGSRGERGLRGRGGGEEGGGGDGAQMEDGAVLFLTHGAETGPSHRGRGSHRGGGEEAILFDRSCKASSPHKSPENAGIFKTGASLDAGIPNVPSIKTGTSRPMRPPIRHASLDMRQLVGKARDAGDGRFQPGECAGRRSEGGRDGMAAQGSLEETFESTQKSSRDGMAARGSLEETSPIRPKIVDGSGIGSGIGAIPSLAAQTPATSMRGPVRHASLDMRRAVEEWRDGRRSFEEASGAPVVTQSSSRSMRPPVRHSSMNVRHMAAREWQVGKEKDRTSEPTQKVPQQEGKERTDGKAGRGRGRRNDGVKREEAASASESKGAGGTKGEDGTVESGRESVWRSIEETAGIPLGRGEGEGKAALRLRVPRPLAPTKSTPIPSSFLPEFSEAARAGWEDGQKKKFEPVLRRLEGQGSRSFPEFLTPQRWDLEEPSDSDFSGPEIPEKTPAAAAAAAAAGSAGLPAAQPCVDPFDFLGKPVVKSRLAQLKEKKGRISRQRSLDSRARGSLGRKGSA